MNQRINIKDFPTLNHCKVVVVVVINKGGLSCTPVHYCTCTCFVVAYFLCKLSHLSHCMCRTRDRCNGEWPRVVAWNAECTSPPAPRCLCHTTQHILVASAVSLIPWLPKCIGPSTTRNVQYKYFKFPPRPN